MPGNQLSRVPRGGIFTPFFSYEDDVSPADQRARADRLVAFLLHRFYTSSRLPFKDLSGRQLCDGGRSRRQLYEKELRHVKGQQSRTLWRVFPLRPRLKTPWCPLALCPCMQAQSPPRTEAWSVFINSLWVPVHYRMGPRAGLVACRAGDGAPCCGDKSERRCGLIFKTLGVC